MKKKIVSLFSAVALFITLVCTAFVNVSAAGESLEVTFSAPAKAKPGDTITVTLNLPENPYGLTGLASTLQFDKETFEVISVDKGTAFPSGMLNDNQHRDEYGDIISDGQYNEINSSGEYAFTYMQLLGLYRETGTLISLKLKVNESAENGIRTFSFNADKAQATGKNPSTDKYTVVYSGKLSIDVSDGLSSDATLKSLTIPSGYGTLAPEFDPEVTDYTVAVPYGKGVPKITAVKNDLKATIQTVQAKSFADGENQAVVTVTAQNKKVTKTYTVTFTEINAMLSALKVNGASVEGFDPDTTSYTYSVPYAEWKADQTKTYTVEATASKETSTVAISENDFALTSTDPKVNSDKSITVTVTADNGTKTVYTVKFTVLACQHNYVKDDARSTPAACETEGEDVLVCSVCADEKNETVAALGHDWSGVPVITPATCETDGSEILTCTRCTESRTKVLSKTGHNWSRWTKVEGTDNYERTCPNAGCEIGTQTRTVKPAEDGHEHDFTSDTCQIEIITPATCTTKGSRIIWCADPTCAGNLPEDIDMIDHDYSRIETIDPTCTTAGSRKTFCTVCGAEGSSEPIDPLGHDYNENVWEKDETGHWHVCTRCGTESDKEAHNEDEGVITTPATTVSAGVKTYSCTVCKYVMRTESIPASGSSDAPVYYPPYIGAPVIPFGGVSTSESIKVSVENKTTGDTFTARAKKNGNTVTVTLGEENDGYYANVFTAEDEYIYSAPIENGKAKFNVPDGAKIKIVIDTDPYGEDVSSAASLHEDTAEANNASACAAVTVLFACAAAAAVLTVKRAKK